MDEITAEYQAAQLSEPALLRSNAEVTVACKTDLGRVRENNEDKFEYYVPEDTNQLASKGQVYVVCDGMGGHAAGQIASELTTKTFIDVYLNHPSSEPDTGLRAAVAAANRYVYDIQRVVPSRKGMGTTLSALILLQDRAYTVQVGDSRIYRLRLGELLQMTTDHTWVEEALRAGLIRPEEVETHPYKHVLNRAIGTEAQVAVDVEQFDLVAGDVYLLCSDGLINHVPDAQIAELLKLAPSESAWKLVASAMQGGGSDNCTVLVIRVDDIARFDV